MNKERRNFSAEVEELCPRVASVASGRTGLRAIYTLSPWTPVTLVLPEPCGAALDRIHLIKQQRIRAWRVNLGLCHLRPSFLFSGTRPGSPRRLPSVAFIASCEGIDTGDVNMGSAEGTSRRFCRPL